MENAPRVRAFRDEDAEAVRDLFVRVNRLLAPPDLADAFEAYIERSLREEIDRIADYYRDHNGSFFVAESAGEIVGMFGLETAGPDAMELRRMYVDSTARGRGTGRALLAHAENQTRCAGKERLILSTSEVQSAALSLYRASGYIQISEEIAEAESNKTLGGGLRRFHFEKRLGG